MSIYIAHRRKTSNALDASVRCGQKRLQRLSETVRDNNRIPQAVRQGIPDRRTSHTACSLKKCNFVLSRFVSLANGSL